MKMYQVLFGNWISRLVSSIVIFVLMTIAATSNSYGQQNSAYDYSKWKEVTPDVTAAMKVLTCSDESNCNFTDSEIKIGSAYEFEDYGIRAKLAWTKSFIFEPSRAVAKRTFKIYDITSMTNEEWSVLRDGYKNSPPLAALVIPRGGGYIGAPVKWNAKFASTFSNALSIAKNANDIDNVMVKAMAGEIIELTADNPIIIEGLRQNSIKTYEEVKRDQIFGAVSDYGAGNLSAVTNLSPKGAIYIGLSYTPEEFSKINIGEIITTDGALGQPLGSVMPSWPTKD